MTREDGDDGADAALDRVVLRYLHRRGYRNAAGVLQTEARLAQALPGANDSARNKVDLSSGMSVAHAMGADAAISDHLLYHSEAERDPATTVHGYGRCGIGRKTRWICTRCAERRSRFILPSTATRRG